MGCRCTGGYRSFSYVCQKTFMIWASTDANVCRALSRQLHGNDSCSCYSFALYAVDLSPLPHCGGPVRLPRSPVDFISFPPSSPTHLDSP